MNMDFKVGDYVRYKSGKRFYRIVHCIRVSNTNSERVCIKDMTTATQMRWIKVRTLEKNYVLSKGASVLFKGK